MGWLKRFTTQHSISQAVVCGEIGCVDEEVVKSVKSHLTVITEGYATCDIYIMDKSRIFFRALPDKTRAKGTECKGGKTLKKGFTAMFCVNMDKEFEKT